jgi:hypothetical protein
MKFRLALCAVALLAPAIARAQIAIPVTADNFNRAETDMYFAMFAKKGGFGKFFHLRELPLEGTGVRPNRDTLYSEAVFDLDAGPVRITLPKMVNRFMSMIVINEDHYVYEVDYTPGNYNFTRGEVGTRYVFMALRILVDPANPKDIKEAHALQDAVIVRQRSPGKRYGQPEEDARRVADDEYDAARPATRIRRAVPGRPGAASDRHGGGLGRQSRQRRHLPQCHAGQKRRFNRL